MIVIDASAMVEFLVGKDRTVVEELGAAMSAPLCAPHLLDFEVMSVLRALTGGGKLSSDSASRACADHFSFAITRYMAHPLASRIWDLRHNYTSYDASYIALAEALDVALVTCDRKLAAGNHHADVRVVGQQHSP